MGAPAFYRCAVASSHFTFEAYGATAEDAAAAFRRGVERHASDATCAPGWAESMIADAEPQPVELGVCYRDGAELTRWPAPMRKPDHR